MNKYQYKVDGIDYTVEIEDIEGNIAKVIVNGKPIEVEMAQAATKHPHPKKVKPAAAAAPAAATAAKEETSAKPQVAAGPGTKVIAPLPGTITAVKVAVGDTVKSGDTVIVLEAMKMQNNIEADHDGTVTSVLVTRGDTVMEGATLITIG